ncbi:MAG: hypothetical protein RMJ88_09315 [Thermogemmata sp.]|nr:hypothetical protein [Thermogemmata sp.]
MSLVLRPPELRESLIDNLAVLGRTRRLHLLVRATAYLWTFVLLLVLSSSMCDVLVSLPGWFRAGELVFILTVTLGLFRWYWLPLWRLRTDPLQVALELENQHPQWHDTLASAVSFLRQQGQRCTHDPHPSASFEAAVIRAARRLQERAEFSVEVPSGPVWRAIGLAVALSLLAGIFALLDRQRAAVALLRLADPYGSHPWPTRTHIHIVEPSVLPERLARGESWALVFVVSGVLPDQAYVDILLADGQQWSDAYPLTRNPVEGNAAPVVVRWEGQRFTGSYQFRLRANDATTPWHTVTVVPPPQFLAWRGRPSPQFRVYPPPYTGLPVADLPDAAAVIEIPMGSILQVDARCDTPLREARLVYVGPIPPLPILSPIGALSVSSPALLPPLLTLHQAFDVDIPLELYAEDTCIRGRFQPPFAGTYAWKLTDKTGLTSTRLLEIRLTPDPVPQVVLHRPIQGQDPPWYLPTAQLAVHFGVTDQRYGLRRISLEYCWEGENVILVRDIFHCENWQPAAAAVLGCPATTLPVKRFRSQGNVNLQELRHFDGRPPRPGDVLHVRLAAWDNDTISPCKPAGYAAVLRDNTETPSADTSRTKNWDFTLTIVTQETLLALIQKELAALLPESMRLRDLHLEAIEQLRQYSSPADNPASITQRERLLRTEQLQRQLRHRVEDHRDGLVARVQRLHTLAQTNTLPPSTVTRRLQAVSDLLGRLAEQELPALDNRLWELREASQTDKPATFGQNLQDRLSALERQQHRVRQQLQALVELLAEWSGAADIRSEAQLLHQRLIQQAGEVQKLGEILPAGRPWEMLDTTQKAELNKEANRLETTAEQITALLQRAARLAEMRRAQADQARKEAEAASQRSTQLQEQAQSLPVDSFQRAILQAEAWQHRLQAEQQRRAAEHAAAEAEALQGAVQAAQGQTATQEVQQAATALRHNQPQQATSLIQRASERLARLVSALREPADDTVPELARLQAAAEAIDALGTAQEILLQRTVQATQMPPSPQRSATQQQLAQQQAQLLQQAQELLQRLQRNDPPAQAVDTLRQAIDHLAAAQDALQRGQPAIHHQSQALQRLDEARDLIDAAAATNLPAERLAEEQRRQLADRLRTLLERQRSRVTEAQRLYERLVNQKRWSRSLQHSFAALADDERQLAEELRSLTDLLRPLPVLDHLLADAIASLERTATRIGDHLQELDPDLPFDETAETARHQRLVQFMTIPVRRLEQILAALQPDAETPSPSASEKRPASARTHASSTSSSELVSPLAQLKALRAWQAEIMQRTAEFARNHVDPTKLSPEDQEELKELESAQRTIGLLFEKLAPLFAKGPSVTELNPSPPDGNELPVAPPPRPADPAPAPAQERSQQWPLPCPCTTGWLLTSFSYSSVDGTLDVQEVGWPQVGSSVRFLLRAGSANYQWHLPVGLWRDVSDEDVAVAPPPRPASSDGQVPVGSPANGPEDVRQIVERIIRNARQASQQLAQAETGPPTQQTQRTILRDIDMLLRPPPPPTPKDDKQPPQSEPQPKKDEASQPMPQTPQKQDKSTDTVKPPPGGMDTIPPPPAGKKPSESNSATAKGDSVSPPAARRPRRASLPHPPSGPMSEIQTNQSTPTGPATTHASQQASTQPATDPRTPASGHPDPNKKKVPINRIPTLLLQDDWMRNVWGHLPDTLRRQASEYYQQELIPRYSKLLEKYYSSRSLKK